MRKLFFAATAALALSSPVYAQGLAKIDGRLRDKGLDGATATDGQLPVWSTSQNKFVMTTVSSGGNETLAQTLALGNSTGANNLVVTAGQLIQFGGATGSFPALSRSGTILQVLLANGSAGATLSVPGSGTNSEAFGSGALASGNTCASLGKFAEAAGDNSIAIGPNTYIPATSDYGTAVGSDAFAAGGVTRTVALGYSARVSAASGLALGASANCASGHTASIALGDTATSSKANQLTVGATGAPVDEILLQGASIATTLRVGSGSPESSVTATVGSIFLRTDGSSGTTLYTKASGSGNTGWEVVGGGATAPLTLALNDSVTDDLSTILTVRHTVSGTAAAGFGATIAFSLENGAGSNQAAADVIAQWIGGTSNARLRFRTNETDALIIDRVSGNTFAAGLKLPVRTVTSGTSATAADHTIIVNASGSNTVALPAAASSTGLVLVVKNVHVTGSVVLDGNGSETIDGATTQTLATQYQSYTLICDGTSWHIQ